VNKMVRQKNIIFFVAFFLLAFITTQLSGCATVPRYMSNDYINKIKNIAVVTNLQDDSLSVLDVTGIRKQENSKQYGGVMYGAIGGALEALIIEGISSYKINSLIGGSITPIQESIAGFDVKATFDDIVNKHFFEHIRANRDIQSLVMLKTVNSLEFPNEQHNSNPDTLLKIEYRYGIGAFTEKKPVPAIVADISAISLPENKKIMSDTIIMYSCDTNNYTLADYAENNGTIYKQCFSEIVEKLIHRIAIVYF
jgi:hypothetical protein